MLSSPKSSPFFNPLVVALDVDTREEALRLAGDLEGLAGGFKLGPRLCLRYGHSLISEVASRAPVFMDNKHFDIPSTMQAAVRASFDAGASVVTVHALSGSEALQKMAELERQLNSIRPFRILAVTILTSWSEASLPPVLRDQPIVDQVRSLASLVKQAGLESIVCSPHELAAVKDLDLYCLTPGVRFSTDSIGDQQRVADPGSALRQGAAALVVGRPIVGAAQPRLAAEAFHQVISSQEHKA